MTINRNPTTDITQNRGKALVVDDDPTNRLVLSSILQKSGYQVVQSEDGQQALADFIQEEPDIIFMDVMMPVMDGYEATRKIKTLTRESFVPVIFLTAITDENELALCIEAGGDDFMTKPINKTLLQAKIQSMERIRDLHRKMGRMYHQLQCDEEVAERIFSRVVSNSNILTDQLHTLLRPAETFSGDMLITAFSPSRDIHIMLADFTGHGLSAALGAMPASEVFRAMIAKGFSPGEILNTINEKLENLFPANMFMAAQYICVNHDMEYVTIYNCGMPDIILLDENAKKINARFISKNLPLGIDVDFDYRNNIDHHQIIQGERIILVSDGIHEAFNDKGEQFGEQRFERALCNGNANAINTVVDKLDIFCGATPQRDDISLVEIPFTPAILPAWNMDVLLDQQQKIDTSPSQVTSNSVELSLMLEADTLRQLDPVPVLLNHLQSLYQEELPKQAIFTILSELFINALDHGLLGLHSNLKQTDTDFIVYLNERKERLHSLDSGFIHFDLKLSKKKKECQLNLQLTDSGDGFDWQQHNDIYTDDSNLYGRGINLVKQLCDEVTYREPGNHVDIVYRWEIG